MHERDRFSLVVGNVEVLGKFIIESMLDEQRLQNAVGRAAEGDGDLGAFEIFEPFDLRPRDQAEGNLIEDLQEHANLFAAKHRLHGRPEGGGIMHAARHQRLDVHRIAAQHDDVDVGKAHLVVKFFLLGDDVGEMLHVPRARQGDIDRFAELSKQRSRHKQQRQYENDHVESFHKNFSK